MVEPLVLYDVPRGIPEGADPSERAWSPHTWKTRYTLNIKGIPYKTVWLEYLDIADELKQFGVAQETRLYNEPKYTCPTIRDPNTQRAISDSETISRYLDDQYPSTPLYPPQTRALQAAMVERTRNFVYLVFSQVVYDTWRAMTAHSKPYIRQSRELILGKKLEDAAATGEERVKALQLVETWLDETHSFIVEGGKDALFLGGNAPLYADADIASVLFWLKNVTGEDSDVWATVSRASGGHWIRYMGEFKKYETVV